MKKIIIGLLTLVSLSAFAQVDLCADSITKFRDLMGEETPIEEILEGRESEIQMIASNYRIDGEVYYRGLKALEQMDLYKEYDEALSAYAKCKLQLLK